VNNYIKTICLVSAFALAACSQAPNLDGIKADGKDINQQLESLKSGPAIDINNLPGKTPTEKLLYLLDTPKAVQSATLIFLDTQISSFEAAGNKTEAEALRKSRVLLAQALEENIDDFITTGASVYDDIFTKDEIEQLTVIYSQPVMQKMTASTIDVQQRLLPLSEEWSNKHVLPRFQQLVKEQAK